MEERLQKWIARCGISSRRAAEELLRQGRVTLNGRVAGLGESGDPERDTLLVDGRPVAEGGSRPPWLPRLPVYGPCHHV